MTQDELEVLHEKVRRGHGAEELLGSPFFTNYLMPFLNDRPAQMLKEYHPPQNRQEMEAVGLMATFQAGRQAELNDLINELQLWVTLGREAKSKLEKHFRAVDARQGVKA